MKEREKEKETKKLSECIIEILLWSDLCFNYCDKYQGKTKKS